MTIRLRAHHLLCLRGFVGMGYTPEFVENMIQIKERLDGGAPVVLMDSCDDICDACPNIGEKGCQIVSPASEKEMQRMDQAVLEMAGLETGKEYSYPKLRDVVDSGIKAMNLKSVCGDCRWLDHCEKF